jgi:hypothetical protein
VSEFDKYYNRNRYPDLSDPEWEQHLDNVAELEMKISIEQTRTAKLEAQAAKLAAERAEVAEASAEAAVKPAPKPTGPPAPDPQKLEEELNKLEPNDWAGAERAFQAAGYRTVDVVGQTWANGRIQRPGLPTQAPEEIYRYLDTATSFEDYQAKLAEVGLLENGAA